MLDSAAKSEKAAREETSETLRVLMPSPLGGLGLELRDGVVTQLVIDPKGKEKASFTPFSDLADSELLDEIFGRLSEFLAGARPDPEIPYDLGPSGVTGFSRRVLREAAKVPYGKTRTYRKIATAAGRPEAYRQVLASLVANPIPVLIPCHRVVTNKSGIGSYIGGQDRKRWLLDMEKEGLKLQSDAQQMR